MSEIESWPHAPLRGLLVRPGHPFHIGEGRGCKSFSKVGGRVAVPVLRGLMVGLPWAHVLGDACPHTSSCLSPGI